MFLEKSMITLYQHLPVFMQDMAYKLAYMLHLEPHHEFVQIVLDAWNDKKPEDPELVETLNYLRKTKGYSLIPCEYTKKYQHTTVKAKKCGGFPMILFEGKKMYFPKSFGRAWATGYYRFLEMELDPESPHCYFSTTFPIPSEDEILLDVGAAEAVVSLQYIEEVKHVFIFECDVNWIEALKKTFEPYKDKITIVNKYISDCDEGDCMQLDTFIRNYYGEEGFDYKYVVKADVEGAETAVLRGSKRLIKSKQSRFAICTYHKPDDAKSFEKIFKEYGYNTEFTHKYMFCGGGI